MNKPKSVDKLVVEQFNQELDALLAGQTSPETDEDAPDADMLAVAKMLAAANVVELSRNRHLSWQQVVKKKQRDASHRRLRYGAVSAALAIGIFLLITTTPLQAWTQAVLARIGAFTITNEAEWIRAQRESISTEVDAHDNPLGQPLSQQEASQKAGFNVLMPTYLPQGFSLAVTDVITETNGAYVTISYAGSGVLTILQWKLPPERQHNMRIGDAAMKTMIIRGHQGYSIEDAGLGAVGNDSAVRPSNDNAILWEEKGILFQVTSGGANTPDFQALSIVELRKIAESLTP